MKTKLTLRLEKDAIEKAKEYSVKKGESVSQIVEKFFKTLPTEKEEITPTVKKLKGLLKNSNIDETDYKNFLEEKYL
ncbi:hypothetical protein SAMN06265339_0162 [Desulfurobacterium pacificum]|uniref:Antitoxin n=1 Tax=Desulfurobacterium pacificum TaxID=240166 RepID=A0ABY1N9T9_9BACT|nr:DUF6364 family protein [Desulfurobacterium pacificum]SMP03938.1 hypothetical protein SAMN06265339_0162 [Desulfurobacterium pacificum]